MSSDATTHDKPHVISLTSYLGVAAALLVLTVITVLVAQVHLGDWNIVVALLIASLKASLVAFIFMHLYYDNKLYFLVFVVSVAFLALLIGLSMADTERRGDLYPELDKPIRQEAIIYTAPADSMSGSHAAPAAGDTTGVPTDTLGDTTSANTHTEPASH